MKEKIINFLIQDHFKSIFYYGIGSFDLGDEVIITWLKSGFIGYYNYSLANLLEEYHFAKNKYYKNKRHNFKKFSKMKKKQ